MSRVLCALLFCVFVVGISGQKLPAVHFKLKDIAHDLKPLLGHQLSARHFKVKDAMYDLGPLLNSFFPTHTSFSHKRLTTYKFTNCGNSTDIGNLTQLDIGPDPLEFPGDITIAFTAAFKQVVDRGLSGSIYLARKVGDTWVKIPCIGLIGSCTYNDVCSLLDMVQQCPQQLVQAGIPCKCPFGVETYKLPQSTFTVGVPLFPAGDYRIIGNLQYNTQHVACADILFSFA